MRPEDTHEGRALIGEQQYMDSLPQHSVADKPCRVCGGDHTNPKDKIIADLLEATKALVKRYDRGTFISCITAGVRRDAKRGSPEAAVFAEWDSARAAIAAAEAAL